MYVQWVDHLGSVNELVAREEVEIGVKLWYKWTTKTGKKPEDGRV